jgi:hypothetical protein
MDTSERVSSAELACKSKPANQMTCQGHAISPHSWHGPSYSPGPEYTVTEYWIGQARHMAYRTSPVRELYKIPVVLSNVIAVSCSLVSPDVVVRRTARRYDRKAPFSDPEETIRSVTRDRSLPIYIPRYLSGKFVKQLRSTESVFHHDYSLSLRVPCEELTLSPTVELGSN